MKKVLILEDNKDINRLLLNMLKKAGYNVFSTFNAFDALKVFKEHNIECIITDLMLPIMSGEEFIQEIRKESNVHIIVISAKITNFEKLDALKKGADDYLFKPFLEDEVLIKLKNLFAKKSNNNDQITFNNRAVIFVEGKTNLIINGTHIHLTALEYQMIKLLITNSNKVVTRNQFLDVLYSFGDEVFDRVIDVHIRNIRRKFNKVSSENLIKTVYGLGYSWVGVEDE